MLAILHLLGMFVADLFRGGAVYRRTMAVGATPQERELAIFLMSGL